MRPSANIDPLPSSEMYRLYSVFGGHILFQTLRTAVQLDLFSLLKAKGPMSRRDIAEKLSLQEQPLRIILLGLTATGLLLKSGDVYSNSEIALQCFTTDSPRKIRAYVELQHRVMYKGLYFLLESVRENRNVGLKEFKGDEPTLYQRLAHDPELEVIFQEAMKELSVQANADMAQSIDLSGVRHLVDIGGGDGTNAIALAKRWPHLKLTVFDSPSVSEIARNNIVRQGLSERVGVQAGNCFVDAFPSDADCLMFCHFFTIWEKDKNLQLLRKCYASLPPGGRVAIFNMMQHDDETGPLSAALGSPYFLAVATGTGMIYSWNEYEALMREAQFTNIERHRLLIDHGLMIARKA